MHVDVPPPVAPADPQAGRWYSHMTRYHWFVFSVASMAWVLDCMDQQLFTVSRDAAITELLGPSQGRPSSPSGLPARAWRAPTAYASQVQEAVRQVHGEDVNEYGGYATSIFLIGWALGGLAFGIMGDRAGRVRTLTCTILLYSFFTGFSAFSQTVWDFALYRFLTGLGVGGVFAVAVSLVAADGARPGRGRHALALLQASSVFGNCAAALLAMGLGSLQQGGTFDNLYLLGLGPIKPWRLMFLVGILPAILVVIIQGHLQEPERWRAAVAAGDKSKAGSFALLFGNPRWRRNALLGLVLAFSGVVGLWAIELGFARIDLQRPS